MTAAKLLKIVRTLNPADQKVLAIIATRMKQRHTARSGRR